MFLKISSYFTLVFLITGSPVSFSQPCEPVFSFSRIRGAFGLKHSSVDNGYNTVGVKSYKELLIRLAQSSLGVASLTSQQVKALETYHQVVKRENGTNGTFARAGNYTVSQRKRIVKFLRRVFTSEQVTALIENGVVEIDRSSNVKITRRVLKRFSEGKKVFIKAHGLIFRINKIIEETNNGFLVEMEWVSAEGQISKVIEFLIVNSNTEANLVIADPANMTKISEKTRSGFVIDVLTDQKGDLGVEQVKGNQIFFSFEKAIRNGLLPKDPTPRDYREIEDILNTYISNYSNQAASNNWKISSYFMANGAMIGSGRLYDNFVDSLQKSLIVGVHRFKLANSESEAIFLAAQSTRKEIASNDFNFPFTNQRHQLTEQGFNSSYTGGIDYISQWVMIRKQLIEQGANPRTTHIEYFANQVPIHIAHIRKSLKTEFTGGRLRQLRNRLKNLEKEAYRVILRKKVTHEWWLRFNFRLARIMSGFATNMRENIDTSSLSFFPIMVIIPAIQTKEGLGIITFNRAGLEGIYPAGLINQKTKMADGNALSAPDFFIHDIFHFYAGGNQLYLEYSAGQRLFHKRLLDNIERLPQEKRKKAEAVYFSMTHEYGNRNIGYSDRTPEQMKKDIKKHIGEEDISGFFRLPDDLPERQKKIEDLTDVFMAVYNQTLQHQQ